MGLQAALGGQIRAFGNRLRQMRAALDVTQSEAAKKAGKFRTDTWSRLERGDATGVRLDMLIGIAEFAASGGISLEWLFAGLGSMQKKEAPGFYDEILKADLPAIRRRLVEMTEAADALAAQQKAGGTQAAPGYRVARIVSRGYEEVAPMDLPKNWRKTHLPIIGRVAAGEGVDTSEAESHPAAVADAYVEYAEPPENGFAVRVVGDSMEPDFRGGDLVIVDPGRRAESGLAVVLFEDANGLRLARLKCLGWQGKTAVLKSVNPAYKPVRIPAARFLAAYEVADHLPLLTEVREEGGEKG